MAGSYPDAPSYRMPYDRDGSSVVWVDDSSGVITAITALAEVNDEDAVEVLMPETGSGKIAILFPEARDFDAYFVSFGVQTGVTFTPGALETSADTTNGQDGTWTSLQNPYTAKTDGGATKPAYRNSIQSVTALGVTAVRFNIGVSPSSGTARVLALHLYGHPASGENVDRLRLWHPTSDAEVGAAYFDWGDTPQGSSADRTFRVKNNSATLTANAVTVAMDVLLDATPSVPGQHSLSADGVNFGAQASVGNLGPGVISDVVTLRRALQSTASLGLWAFRVFAEADSWT